MNISSLEELFNKINCCGLELCDTADLINSYNGTDWAKYINFNDAKYWKETVHINDNIELVVISWKKGQCSKIHDHPSKGCLLKILSGELTEEIYDSNKNKLITNILKTNNIGYQVGNKKLHNIISNTRDTISLHIYSPPNHKTKYY